MIRAAALAVLLLAGCAATPPPLADTPEASSACDVEVSFGSYAMGVDGDLKTRILAVIASADGVESSDERRWGREGESTVCIQTASARAADRLFNDIAALIPETSPRAPTTVTHRDGRSRASGPPPEWN